MTLVKIVLAPQHKKNNQTNHCQDLTSTRTWKCARCTMQMSYSGLPFKSFCKLAKRAETIKTLQKRILVMINHFLGNSEINSIPEWRVFLPNAKVYAHSNLREQILFIQIAKLKKFSALKNSPCQLTQSIKVHRRALVLLLYLIPYLIVVKWELQCSRKRYKQFQQLAGRPISLVFYCFLFLWKLQYSWKDTNNFN